MTEKYELINKLIETKGFKSFLEIGVGGEFATFKNVVVDKKVGVDPDNSIQREGFEIIHSNSDEYFSQLSADTKFDVIYIDGDHSRDAVLRDFDNAVKHLNTGGILVLHDIGPQYEKDTATTASGTAYQAWIRIRGLSEYKSFSYEFSGDKDVVGLVVVAENDNILQNGEENFTYFNNNRDAVLNRKSLEDIVSILTTPIVVEDETKTEDTQPEEVKVEEEKPKPKSTRGRKKKTS